MKLIFWSSTQLESWTTSDSRSELRKSCKKWTTGQRLPTVCKHRVSFCHLADQVIRSRARRRLSKNNRLFRFPRPDITMTKEKLWSWQTVGGVLDYSGTTDVCDKPYSACFCLILNSCCPHFSPWFRKDYAIFKIEFRKKNNTKTKALKMIVGNSKFNLRTGFCGKPLSALVHLNEQLIALDTISRLITCLLITRTDPSSATCALVDRCQSSRRLCSWALWSRKPTTWNIDALF